MVIFVTRIGPANSSHKSGNSFTANGSTAVKSITQEKRWVITLRKLSLTPKSQMNTAAAKIHYLTVTTHALAHPSPPY